MTGHREEPGLGTVSGLCLIAGLGERAFGLGAIGNVAADASHLGRLAGIRSDQAFPPRDPSSPERARDLLVVARCAICQQRGLALFKHIEGEFTADQRALRPLGQLAIGVVGKSERALEVAQHDQIALRLEQAAGALLRFLQFPIAVGQCFIVERDLAQFLAHPAQAEAQGSQRYTGDREQEGCAHCKSVRVIAGLFSLASGEKAEGAAKRGGENHERAGRER